MQKTADPDDPQQFTEDPQPWINATRQLCGHHPHRPGCPVCARSAAAAAVQNLPDLEAEA